MSIAKTPSAELTYKGFVQTRTAQNLQTTITYQSTEQKLNAMITGAGHETSGWNIGMSGVYGNLDKITMKQQEGPFWHADLQWNRPLSAGVIITTGNSTKPTESNLTVTMIEMSLQTLPNYADIWTKYLAERSDNEVSVTLDGLLALTGAARTTSDPTNDCLTLKWLNDKSDLPDPQTDENGDPVTWSIKFEPTKLGIDYYMVPTYEITEYAKHSNKQNAAWSLVTKDGKLKYPQNRDFGLQNRWFPNCTTGNSPKYHWLCLGGDLNFDGKYWVARCTYRWSPDTNGWDQDMYQVASGGYGNPANNNNNIFNL